MKLLLITALLFFAGCNQYAGTTLQESPAGVGQTCLEGVVYYRTPSYPHGYFNYTAKFLPSGKVATCGEGR